MENKQYQVGDRVKHLNHGWGTVVVDSGKEMSDWDVTVDFDVQPKGWDRTLTVSKGMIEIR